MSYIFNRTMGVLYLITALFLLGSLHYGVFNFAAKSTLIIAFFLFFLSGILLLINTVQKLICLETYQRLVYNLSIGLTVNGLVGLTLLLIFAIQQTKIPNMLFIWSPCSLFIGAYAWNILHLKKTEAK